MSFSSMHNDYLDPDRHLGGGGAADEEANEEPPLTVVEQEHAAQNMRSYAGGWVALLGEAFQRAPNEDRERILGAFPDLFATYADWTP